jgi:uncharacterized protein YraI
MPHRALALLISVVVFLSVAAGTTTATAGALIYGTAAWTNKELPLYEGPGTRYDVVGDVSGEIRIRVERCTKTWCFIRGDKGDGWAAIDHLSFGQAPGTFHDGPNLHYPHGGPGIVCFYSGEGYTGTSVCAETGFVVPDLLLYELDNRFASVTIEGDVSVIVCRDRDFKSYCERVIQSDPALNEFLYRNVSSYRVY